MSQIYSASYNCFLNSVVFWEKITEIFLKKFNIRLNYIVVSISVLVIIAIIILLINF